MTKNLASLALVLALAGCGLAPQPQPQQTLPAVLQFPRPVPYQAAP